MDIIIPGYGPLKINTIILDLNGTLTVGGNLVDGVEERIKRVQEKNIKLVLFSGDTRGNAAKIANDLGIEFIQAGSADDKALIAQRLNPETCAAIGNGQIDYKKMQTVKLSIVTLQAEGVHTKTLLESDIIVPSINDALDLFIDENRLIATLRF